MRRVAPCLILLLAPPLACAAALGSYAESDSSPCLEAQASPAQVSPSASDARSAARPPAHPPAISQGGGSDSDLVLPKPRIPRWHSFLPGMFR